MYEWSPTSWQLYRYEQAAFYSDTQQLTNVVHQLSQLPPLVTGEDIKSLKQVIARAGRGEAFILQGGDCAESFNDCHTDVISKKLKILLQMSLILMHGLGKPIVCIGRIAGQYTKPRSSAYETIDNITLPSYRGDLVNSDQFNVVARTPNPHLMLQGYQCAAQTLHIIRTLSDHGFTDLGHAHHWDLSFVNSLPQAPEYHAMIHSLLKESPHFLNKIEFFTSHEALHLHYEQALTRCTDSNHWYNLSTHLPWIGIRTAKLNSAHLEFLRGIRNPIGVKIGPTATPDWLAKVIQLLNPEREEGRLLLITRLGAKDIQQLLPPLIEKVKTLECPVTWSCDPMHGNTEFTPSGIKTRHFDNIFSELQQAIHIHQTMDSYLGGVHFELTGDNVTECIGGARGLSQDDLAQAYHSLVDPRLNYEQSLEMAIQLSRQYQRLCL